MYILSADALIEEALNAHHIGEVIVGLHLACHYALRRESVFFLAPQLLFVALLQEVPEKQDKVESELLASFTSPSGLHIPAVSRAALITFWNSSLARYVQCNLEWHLFFQALNLKRRGEAVK